MSDFLLALTWLISGVASGVVFAEAWRTRDPLLVPPASLLFFASLLCGGGWLS